MRTTLQWTAACLITAFFVGCGSSTPPASSGGTIATPMGGTTATGGTTAAGGSSAPTSVPCGATTCTNPAAAAITQLKQFLPSAMLATPCCSAAMTCGWMMATGCEVPPPKKNCPAPAAIPGFGGGLTACCNASTNTCGIDAYAIGMGCMASFGGGAAANCDTGVAPGGAAGGTAVGGAPATAGMGAGGATATAGASAGGALAAGAGGLGAAGAQAGTGAGGAPAGGAPAGGSGAAGAHAGAGGH